MSFWQALLLVIGLFSLEASAADFTVNSVADKVDVSPGDGKCSTGGLVDGKTPECTLRAAINEVNALSVANPGRTYTVALGAGTYATSITEPCPYHDVGNPNLLSRDTTTLCISGNLSITGGGPGVSIIDGGHLDRVFFASVGATVALDDMTIQHGSMAVAGTFDGSGGGINNQGTMTVSNIVFSQNDANNPSHGGGGAIYNAGTLAVLGSTFTQNADTALTARGFTSIDQSYFTQNSGAQGSAINMFGGSLQVSNSTISQNSVDSDGIVAVFDGPAAFVNSTISNNTIGNAAAIQSGGNGSSLTLNNVTVYGNIAKTSLGGVLADTAIIANSILAGNTPSDCAIQGLSNLGHNLIQTADAGDFKSVCAIGTSVATLTGVDAKLSPLAINAGNLPTNVPLPGSPAIGAGSTATPGSNLLSACTDFDESGFLRGQFGRCSIGASEPLAGGGLHINNVLPKTLGASGTATVVVHGTGFVDGSTVVFQKSGSPSLTAVQAAVAADNLSISVTLDLSAAGVGSYEALVTTPGGARTTMSGALTVQNTDRPDIYSYVLGSPIARANSPSFYTVIVGNRGNTDAYLVPVTLALPGNLTGAINSEILPPPPATGQAITDWTQVPLEVAPLSSIAFTSVPLLIPVLPAGAESALTFYMNVLHHPFIVDANHGTPYGTTAQGGLDSGVLSQLVAGAQAYAQTNFGVTLSATDLAQMTTYAASQLAQVVAGGNASIIATAAAEQPFFSTAQLTIDVAAFGARLEGKVAAVASNKATLAGVRKMLVADSSAAPPAVGKVPCSGQVLAPGASCGSLPNQVPSKPGTSGRLSCSNLILHLLADDGACVPKGSICPSSNPDDPKCASATLPVASFDPNAKVGLRGVGSAHFVTARDPFHYSVEFENSASATAAAQVVTVTDQLDTTKYDLSTFQLNSISFGRYVVTPSPGLTSFSKGLDLRPAANVIVSITAKLDSHSGLATWTFTSLDPATLKIVTDPLAGFLPPDSKPPAGIGHVEFSVRPLSSLVSGTQICNSATIVFDTNAPIATAAYCNGKDTVPPSSHVKALPAVTATTSFAVSWSGTDAGSGIASYSIFVSDNGGPFAALISNTETTDIQFSGISGHAYSFYSLATDAVGNVEPGKTVGDTSTSVNTTLTIAVPNVVGLTQASAMAAIAAVNLAVGPVTSQRSATIAAGVVISESPGAGTRVASKSKIALVISSGPATVTVPNVLGLTQAAAAASIASSTLILGNISTASSPTVAKGLVISESPAAGTSVAAKSSVSLVISSGPALVTVPNVVGLSTASADAAISAAGLLPGTLTTSSSSSVAKGLILSEIPAAGSSVAAKSVVNLVISSGPAMATVPNVVGLTQVAAGTAIASAGLALGTVTMQSNATIAAGVVISENPTAGASVPTHSAVSLVVSSGPASIDVPNVIGQTQAAATATITGAGLTVGKVTTLSSASVPNQNVISESPAAGSHVAPKTPINLVISTGPLLGDVNGDGVVNCADLDLVKAALGSKKGQPNYNPRADINGDGMVSVLDLAIVAKNVPAGTTCN